MLYCEYEVPTCPINTLNLYQRVLKDKTRVTNYVEGWHGVVTPYIKRKMPAKNATV